MSRQISFAIGASNPAMVERYQLCGFQASVLISGVGAVMSYLFIWYGYRNYADVGSLFAVLVLSSGLTLQTYVQALLRSKLLFKDAAIHLLKGAIALILAAMAALAEYAFTWLACLFGLALLIASCAEISRLGVMRRAPQLDVPVFRELVRQGLPIALVGILYAVATSVDRWVVVGVLGPQSLGEYSLAYALFNGVVLAVTLAVAQLYPSYARDFGATGSIREVRKRLWRDAKVLGAASATLALLASLVPSELVSRTFPGYDASAASAKVLAMGAPFLGLALLFSSFCNAVGLQGLALRSVLAATAVNTMLATAAAYCGYGVMGVAAATVLGYCSYFALLLVAIYRLRLISQPA